MIFYFTPSLHFDPEENMTLCKELIIFLHEAINELECNVQQITSIDQLTLLLHDKFSTDICQVLYWRTIIHDNCRPRFPKFLKFLEKNITTPLKKLSKSLTDDYDGTDEELGIRATLEFCLMNYLEIMAQYNFFDKDNRHGAWEFIKDLLLNVFFTGITTQLWPAIGQVLKAIFIDNDQKMANCSEFINFLLEEFTRLQNIKKNKNDHGTSDMADLADMSDMQLTEDDGYNQRTDIKMKIFHLEDMLNNMDLGNCNNNEDDQNQRNLIVAEMAKLKIQLKNEKVSAGFYQSCDIIVRLLHQIVEFICQTVLSLDISNYLIAISETDATMINSNDLRQIRIIEQWSKEIIDLSLEYAKTADFGCFTLSVYKAFGLIGTVSPVVAKQATLLFINYLENQDNIQTCLDDPFSDENIVTGIIIDCMTDFLLIHDLIVILDFGEDEINLGKNQNQKDEECSPQQTFIKRYVKLILYLFKIHDCSNLAVNCLTSLIKLFLNGILSEDFHHLLTYFLVYLVNNSDLENTAALNLAAIGNTPDAKRFENKSEILRIQTQNKIKCKSIVTIFFNKMFVSVQDQEIYLVNNLFEILKKGESYRAKMVKEKENAFELVDVASLLVNLVTEPKLRYRMFKILTQSCDPEKMVVNKTKGPYKSQKVLDKKIDELFTKLEEVDIMVVLHIFDILIIEEDREIYSDILERLRRFKKLLDGAGYNKSVLNKLKSIIEKYKNSTAMSQNSK